LNTLIKNAKENPEEFLAISKSVTALLDNSPIPFIGSNSWVIAQRKLKMVKILQMIHIWFSQPRTWYEAHSNT
jgi:penicillin amidase